MKFSDLEDGVYHVFGTDYGLDDLLNLHAPVPPEARPSATRR